jgi:large subunit ribosomal protein L17
MRHKKAINHLGRNSSHRKAMLANMASSLIMHKRIETTTAKAKALKRYIEPLITHAKEDSTHSRRVVFGYLQDKEAVTELFREVSAKVGDRPGGYTRIIKLGHRLGDAADMCLIELVDYNENLLAEKASAKKAAGRRRRGSKKKGEAAAAPVAKAGAAAGTVVAPAESAEADAGTAEPVIETPETAVEEVVETPEAAVEEVVETPETPAEEAVETPEAAAEEVAETTGEAAGEKQEDAEGKEDNQDEKKES